MNTDRLLTLIAERTPPDQVGRMQEALLGMVCNESQPIPLGEKELYDALIREGEFLVLRMNYDDIEKELKERKLERKIGEAQSLLVSFEEDGSHPELIEEFVKYLHDRLDPLQNFRFGIKRAKAPSEYPVTMLLSGILPINQLHLFVGEGIEKLIGENRDTLLPHFLELRRRLSQEVGLPILSLHRSVDESLAPAQVRLVDTTDGSVLCEFVVEELSPEGLEIYLQKLSFVLKSLATEWKNRRETAE
jgi:hypothetical protein